MVGLHLAHDSYLYFTFKVHKSIFHFVLKRQETAVKLIWILEMGKYMWSLSPTIKRWKSQHENIHFNSGDFWELSHFMPHCFTETLRLRLFLCWHESWKSFFTSSLFSFKKCWLVFRFAPGITECVWCILLCILLFSWFSSFQMFFFTTSCYTLEKHLCCEALEDFVCRYEVPVLNNGDE